MAPSNTAVSLFCILSAVLWSTGGGIDCESRTTCRACINMDSVCGWCADEGVRIDDRCRKNGTHTDCNNVFSPVSDIDDQEQQMPSISPGRYNVSLRANDTLLLPIDIMTIRNIPLDLYILFDVSQSQREEISAIQGVSDNIIDRLERITDNVQVGVGSYIDKPVLPYTRQDLNEENECVGVCYNFRHYGPMTNDRLELRSRFERVETGSNIDAPEAGLDAMAQAALCDDQVGWRDSAVKMILYFTDDAFKFAGEGRHAGIVRPFEEVCGLEEVDANTTEYTGVDNDYTSPGQLLHIFETSNIVPVFIAVTSDTQAESFYSVPDTHVEMARLFNIRLNGRASAAAVDTSGNNDAIAENLLGIIDQQVLLILMQTGLSPDSEGLKGISFSVQADCPPGAVKQDAGSDMESCSSVGVGNTTRFNLSVTLLDCELFGSEPKEIKVAVFPLGQVIVQVTPICTCRCEDYEENSTRCNFNGNYSCGECTCNTGYCGLQCQFKEEEQRTCLVGIGGEVCSGERGSCLTCECICEEDLRSFVNDIRLQRPGVNASAFGRACECDYFSCLPISNTSATEVCSGRGDCCDGRCNCSLDGNGYRYRSDGTDLLDCSCEPAEIVCKASESDKLCEGVGECDCEGCNCPAPYDGEHCENLILEDCFDIATELEIERCILEEKNRTNDNSVCQTCSFSLINVVNVSCVVLIPESEQPRNSDVDEVERIIEEFAAKELTGNSYQFLKMCSFTDNNTCTHDYYVVYNKDDTSELVFIAEEQRTCISTTSNLLDNLGIPLWALAVILLGVLLFLGILILAFIKAVFLLLDYFEVKRLEKEVGMADFSKNQNPLYQSPDVEYKNVAYGKE